MELRHARALPALPLDRLRGPWAVADALTESVSLTVLAFALLFTALYVALPALAADGVSWFVAFAAVNLAWNALLVIAALIGRAHLPVRPLAERAALRGAARWSAAAAVLLAAVLWTVAVAPFTAGLIVLRPPFLAGLASVSGWGVSPPTGLLLWLAVLVGNVVSEEMWWRWFVLGRQARAFGDRAWIANGLCWGLGHLLVFPWAVLSILPLTLGVPLVTQRSGRLLPGALVHLAYDGLGILVVLQLFAGR